MWTEIDSMRAEEDHLGTYKGYGVQTYASQVGTIGCTVMVIVTDNGQPSITFVPGVKLEKKPDGGWHLVVADGYGEMAKTVDFQRY